MAELYHGGGGAGTFAKDRSATEIRDLISEFSAANGRLAEVCVRTESAADRLVGPIQTSNGTAEGPSPVPNGAIDELGMALSRLQNLITTCDVNLSRIERAVGR